MHFRRLRCADAHLLFQLSGTDTFGITVYDKCGNPCVSFALIRHGEYDIRACQPAVCYEFLMSVEHIVIALIHRGG